MIRLGLRFTLRGGREGQARLLFTTLGVALAATLLLFTLAGFNGIAANDARQGWLTTSEQNRLPSVDESTSDPLWWRLSLDSYMGREVTVVEVAATGAAAPVTPGLDRLPAAGEYYASPALSRLLETTPPDLLAQRFPGRLAGVIGEPGLTSPDALTAVVGLAPEALADAPGVVLVRSIETAPKEHDYGEFLEVVLGIGAVGLLLPVLVFVMTSTRLAAARREERFAALRLVGATPRQVRAIAAVEAALGAGVGTVLGFALFWLFRPLVARIPFTGHPFFTGDLSLSWMAIVAVLVGVPVVAAVAGLVALRRVNISPLGVARRAPRKRPRAWRVLPVLIGLGLLAMPGSIGDPQTRTFMVVGIFALIVVGLVIAGPWLTLVGARVLVRLARRDSTLIAARRLGDDPGRGFRAISGIVLAVFIGTVFAAVVGTAIRDGGGSFSQRDLPESTLVQPVSSSVAASAGAALADSVCGLPGVTAVVPVWEASGAAFEGSGPTAGLIVERDWQTLGLSKPVQVGRQGLLALDYSILGNGNVHQEGLSADGLEAGRLALLLVATDGQAESIERARTFLEVGLPDGVQNPYTIAELSAAEQSLMSMLERMVTVGVILCLVIAGCSLAVSVAGGLVERKRPLTLLRLSGMPLWRLYRAVILEAAVPLALAALVSALAGFLVAGLILSSSGGGLALVAPGWSYYVMMLGGVLAAMGVVCVTLPLLGKVTEPVAVRTE